MSRKLIIISILLIPLLIIIIVKAWSANSRTHNNLKTQIDRKNNQDVAEKTNEENCSASKGAWFGWWEEAKALESLSIHKDKVSSISPVWYFIDENGRLNEYNYKLRDEFTSIAQENDIILTPTINNADGFDFDEERIHLLLEDNRLTEDLISDLVRIASGKGYDGWDLDWEQIDESDKVKFSSFVKNLANKLHRNDLILSVTVHARTGKSSDWTKVRGQDWNELGKYADSIRIMAYDFSGSHSDPGPIIPMDKLKQVIKFANNNIPPEKIVIALPTYGYKWEDEEVTSLQYDEILRELVDENKASFDFVSGSNFYDFDSGESIWFEGTESLKVKTQLIKSEGICSFYFWKLGGENKIIWDL